MERSVIPEWLRVIEWTTRDDAVRSGLCREGVQEWVEQKRLKNVTAVHCDALAKLSTAEDDRPVRACRLAGSGDGDGSGYGYGSGDGDGYGSGDGSGDGYGDDSD